MVSDDRKESVKEGTTPPSGAFYNLERHYGMYVLRSLLKSFRGTVHGEAGLTVNQE